MDISREIKLVVDKLQGVKKVNGNEYNATCPYCNRAKKFYINEETGLFSCKAGSCAEKGNINKLLEHFGSSERVHYDVEISKKVVAVDKSVQKKFIDFSFQTENKFTDYLLSRGITLETAIAMKAGYLEEQNALAFPSYVDDRLIGVEYRRIDVKKIFQESGSSHNLLKKSKNIDFKNDTLYIAEGWFDAATLVECGMQNVVSVPNGVSNMSWIEGDWVFLNKFKNIVLLFDNDDAGMTAFNEAKKRLDFASLYTIEMFDYNDINDFYNDDTKKFSECLSDLKLVDLDNFIDLSDLKTIDNMEESYYSSGIAGIDELFNGLAMHENTIICSPSGSGKSVTIANMINGIISSGEKVAIFSGEFSNTKLKTIIYQIIAGENGIESKQHPIIKDKQIYSIKPSIEKKIDKKIRGKLFIYDGSESDGFSMLKSFEVLHKRYGVKFFFIDNLSIIKTDVKGVSKWDGQDEFARESARFVKVNKVHLFCITHPTKNKLDEDNDYVKKDGTIKPLPKWSQESVKGAGGICNLAHNILFMQRCYDHEKLYVAQEVEKLLRKNNRDHEVAEKRDVIMKELSLLLYLVKQRSEGDIYKNKLFGYDSLTKRIYTLFNKEDNDLFADEKVNEVIEQYSKDDFI